MWKWKPWWDTFHLNYSYFWTSTQDLVVASEVGCTDYTDISTCSWTYNEQTGSNWLTADHASWVDCNHDPHSWRLAGAFPHTGILQFHEPGQGWKDVTISGLAAGASGSTTNPPQAAGITA